MVVVPPDGFTADFHTGIVAMQNFTQGIVDRWYVGGIVVVVGGGGGSIEYE